MQDSPDLSTIERLARVLEHFGVDYCVIGGVAANFHGSPRLTHDIDILSRGGLENLTRLALALDELGARAGDGRVSVEHLRAVNTRWVTSIGRVDVLLAAKGPNGTSIRYIDVAANVLAVRPADGHGSIQIVGPSDRVCCDSSWAPTDPRIVSISPRCSPPIRTFLALRHHQRHAPHV